MGKRGGSERGGGVLGKKSLVFTYEEGESAEASNLFGFLPDITSQTHQTQSKPTKGNISQKQIMFF